MCVLGVPIQRILTTKGAGDIRSEVINGFSGHNGQYQRHQHHT